MAFDKILENVEKYYTQKIISHGPTAQGVDWNSQESQFLRFKQLLKVCDDRDNFSINDYGCGYGSLIDYMTKTGLCFSRYYGFDISEEMLDQARRVYQGFNNCTFSSDKSSVPVLDYTVASGIFNVKSAVADQAWRSYILATLDEINGLSKKGFSFNILTKYSDPDRMRQSLYYADPCYFFDYCKRHFSKNVALLHDYDLYEFTLVVRK